MNDETYANARSAAIFRQALANAQREKGPTKPARPAGPCELEWLDQEIGRLNDLIGREEGPLPGLEQLRADQIRHAGVARLRDDHGGCLVLTELSKRTDAELSRARSRLEELQARRAALQARRQEILSGVTA